MNRRRLLTTLGLWALAAPLDAFAQQQDRARRIGFLAVRSQSTPSSPDVYYDAFVKGMQDLGYVEGKNLIIEWRAAEGKYERLPELAADLVRLKTEIIVTHGPGTRAAQKATETIPIVMAATNDPIASGIIKSLAKPEGNITGLSILIVDMSRKHLELVKTLLPNSSRVAVLNNPANPSYASVMKAMQAAGQQLGIVILPVDASNPQDIEGGFATMTRERAEAVIVVSDAFFTGQRRQISELAVKNRIASIFSSREFVEAGCLASYGQNLAEFYARAAYYVDKILKGAKPTELAIEQPTKFELVINLKTAKALGLTRPADAARPRR